MIGVAVAVLALAGAGWFFMSKGSSEPKRRPQRPRLTRPARRL